MKKDTNMTEELKGRNYKICNLDYLYEVSNGNSKFIRDMIRLFLTEVPAEIESLEKSIIEKNFDLIRQAAHKLKSSLPFVGLDKVIRNEISQIEKLAAEESNPEKIEELFSTVKKTCGEAAEELKQ